MNAVATQRMTMRHWGVLATCVFCTFGCAAVAFSVPGLCYRPVSQYLGVDVFDVSLYMTIVYLTEVVLSAPVGRLLQRWRRARSTRGTRTRAGRRGGAVP